MRIRYKITMAIGAALLLSSPPLAYGQGFQSRGGFGGAGMLLRNEGVQKELKLDKEQVEKATEALQKVFAKYQDSFANFREMSEADRQKLLKTMNDDTMKVVAEVLKPEQVKRLKQIVLQQGGADAFNDPDAQKSLKLTDEQKSKIKTITEDAGKEIRGLFQGGGGFSEETRKKMDSIRKDSLERITALLTADQKQSWKELTGEPFEVKFEFRRRN